MRVKPRWQTVQRKCFSEGDFMMAHRGEAYDDGGTQSGVKIVDKVRSVSRMQSCL